MQSRKSGDFERSHLIWGASSQGCPETATVSQQAIEYFQRRVGFFESQLRAARQRRQEKLIRRAERREEKRALREKRREQWEAEAKARGYTPCRIVNRPDAPDYLKRQYIYKGYLVGGTPWEAAWNTLFHLNNETLNAWTMVPPFILSWLGVFLARKHLPGEIGAFWMMLISCAPHAPFSIGLHLTDGTSRAWRDLWRALDVFFIFSCGVPRAAALAWYVFYEWRHYAIFMIIALSIYGRSAYRNIVCGRIKDISKPELAKAVTITIVCYASPVVLASISEYRSEGWGKICNLTLAIACTFIISTLTYGCKFPERWAPGKFDLIGNGHSLMHISTTIEYGLELLFLWHMATQKAAVKQSAEKDDQVVRKLLGSIGAL